LRCVDFYNFASTLCVSMKEETNPRCTGHCCRGFAVENSYEEIWEDFRRWRKNPSTSTIKDIYLLAPMLVPIREIKGEWLYTCKHLKKNGDCAIYEYRPQMCRDFPGDEPCPFGLCASHGHKNIFQKIIAWLRT